MATRVAVVGCGQWGQNHVRALAEFGVLAAVADRDPAKAARFAERYGVRGLSPDEAVESADLDALVLALPAVVHGPVARRALAAAKDVLVEKPIALDPADALATAEAARRANRILMVGHVLRYHPVFQELARQVAARRIGAVRHIVAMRQGLGRFLGMDAVWDLAPHDLSLVLKIAGEAPVRIETMRRTVLSDDTDAADIALGFESGVSAEIHVSRVSPYRDRRFSVIGSEGMLTFDDLAPEGQKLAFHPHRVWREAPGGFGFRHADAEFIETEPGLPLDRELRHFLHCVEHRSEPETGAAEAVETVRILAQASPPPRD
ncbi:Gfo/Idh/MocA family oxidoreductase [Aureimonas leprariae]|uniref:Gfo/Idh/MocA family oxidoreductase n=1 Tax=Plantimonas leprariae TaxID=2615207 RepID=A0A7V7PTK1_9HYPH|nr:Gfo/Idh/MocA family oxidoreductase [Aureimonas leprariae]